MCWGASLSFFYWNSLNTKLSLGFNKNKAICRGVFIIFLWFYCKYHVGLHVIGYLYVYKLPQTLGSGMVARPKSFESDNHASK
jgi:hypothetical protein